MDFKNKQLIGWIQGFVAVFLLLGLTEVVCRYSLVMLNVNPVVFSCCAFSSSAFMLILVGGSGPLVKETIRSVDTWVYGLVLMLSYITGMILYSYVTSTELTMIQKVSVALSLFCSWLFIGRKPDFYQLLGTVVATIGVCIVAYDVNSGDKGFVFFVALLHGIGQAARIFVAELHRPHAKASTLTADPRAKARVIGFVMLVVSVLFLTGSFLIALIQDIDGQVISKGLPTFADFMHPQTVISGFLIGMCLIAPLRILEFSSSQRIKAENFITILTFATVATLFWEWITGPITGLSIKSITGLDLVAMIFITAGGLIISLTRKFKKKDPFDDFLKYSTQDLDSIEETRELMANALEHFKSDIKKTAKALGVPIKVIGAILEDSDKVLTFKKEVLRKVASNYRKKVANSDALTGLVNRVGFMTSLKAAKFEADQFSLLMIDLNKFKPVNDTYGHAAGDFVLQEIGKRLKGLFKTKSLATRLGGDEFSVLLIGSDKADAKQKLKKVKQELERDVFYENNKINVSGSIGIASYPEDTKSAEEMIKIADDGMYRDKGGRRR
ncbi:MAG: diguanylate cyclase [Proteobacteria bacterium]|nr:diguanylate cyclase [Pseudomonadota bacterium]